MCAGGPAGVDQLLGSKIRRLFKAQQLSCNGDLKIGRAVEGPFVASEKKTIQSIAQPRQDLFAIRSCLSLTTRNKALTVWSQVNTAFSKLFHTISFGIPCATTQRTASNRGYSSTVNEEVGCMLETVHEVGGAEAA